MPKRYRSDALAAVHEIAQGLAEAGTMDKRRLRDSAKSRSACQIH